MLISVRDSRRGRTGGLLCSGEGSWFRGTGWLPNRPISKNWRRKLPLGTLFVGVVIYTLFVVTMTMMYSYGSSSSSSFVFPSSSPLSSEEITEGRRKEEGREEAGRKEEEEAEEERKEEARTKRKLSKEKREKIIYELIETLASSSSSSSLSASSLGLFEEDLEIAEEEKNPPNAEAALERFADIIAEVLVQKIMKIEEERLTSHSSPLLRFGHPPPPPALPPLLPSRPQNPLTAPFPRVAFDDPFAPVTSTTSNEDQCLLVKRNVDVYHFGNHEKFWWNMSDSLVRARRKSWKRWVQKTPERPPSQYLFSGRGIITLAGNGDTFRRALTQIRMLHYWNCTLPIEVWFIKGELDSFQIEQIEELGASPRDATDPSLPFPMKALKDKKKTKNFQLKSAIILNSAFKEVLYLDSDNLPLIDPTSLFERPAYKLTGAVFWPDFWKTAKENPIWRVLDLPCRDSWEQESGQVLVDKERHWRPLSLSYFFSRAHPFYFQLINGDKDTFRFAFLALNVTVAWPRRFLASAGHVWRYKYCGNTMVQADIPTSEELEAIRPGQSLSTDLEDLLEEEDEDAPPRYLFLHANLIKDVPQSVYGTDPGPWQVLRRYRLDSSNLFLRPIFINTYEGYPCMELTSAEGESEIVEVPFDEAFPGFRKLYWELDGPGGNDKEPWKIGPTEEREVQKLTQLELLKQLAKVNDWSSDNEILRKEIEEKIAMQANDYSDADFYDFYGNEDLDTGEGKQKGIEQEANARRKEAEKEEEEEEEVEVEVEVDVEEIQGKEESEEDVAEEAEYEEEEEEEEEKLEE